VPETLDLIATKSTEWPKNRTPNVAPVHDRTSSLSKFESFYADSAGKTHSSFTALGLFALAAVTALKFIGDDLRYLASVRWSSAS